MTTRTGVPDEGAECLRELSDPEFFSRWAAVRTKLALTPASSPGSEEARRDYDAVAAEYRRRLEGAA